MDGRGRWMDNVFIERLWRSLKHEDVYLRGYADGCEARAGIGEWIAFYNERRLHQALDYRTPMAILRQGAAGGTCGHGDKTLSVQPIRRSRALTTCPQEEQKQQQAQSLAACTKHKQQTGFQLDRTQNRSRFPEPLQSARKPSTIRTSSIG